MKFIAIEPRKTSIRYISAKSLDAAKKLVEPPLDRVDHGTLSRRVKIALDEFGLMRELNLGYFALRDSLFAGNAVVFAYDDEGETMCIQRLSEQFSIDILGTLHHTCIFFPNAQAVERAIAEDLVIRPKTTVNGVVVWSWTPPQSSSVEAAKEAASKIVDEVTPKIIGGK